MGGKSGRRKVGWTYEGPRAGAESAPTPHAGARKGFAGLNLGCPHSLRQPACAYASSTVFSAALTITAATPGPRRSKRAVTN